MITKEDQKIVVEIVCNKDTGEAMVIWPNGEVEFVNSFFGMLKILWFLVRRGASIEVTESGDIK